VIACDFDGTGAVNGQPAPELYAVLAEARARGILTLLATGRVLEEVQRLCENAPFDVIVAENGAIVCFSGVGHIIQLGSLPPERFLDELRATGIPFHTGAVIVATRQQYASQLLHLIRRFGLDAQLIYNRNDVMLLPSGIDKATGIRRALDTMGRSERNMVAFGDAENDIPMLMTAAVGVAARDSIPAVLALADDRVPQPGGAGVALYIRRILKDGGTLPNPRRKKISRGRTSDGNDR
jgi:HAD superfamily hydrolase (TIGR01484 family)